MGFFKGLKNFVLDYAVPIGLSFIPGVGIPLAAAYSGIKTGIETGSALAGLGAGALSFGLGHAAKGISGGIQGAAPGIGSSAAQNAAKAGTTSSFMALSDKAAQQGLTSGIKTGVSQGFANISPQVAKNIGYTGAISPVSNNIIGSTAGSGSFLQGSKGLLSGAVGRVGQGSTSLIDKVASPISKTFSGASGGIDALQNLQPISLDPTGIITDKKVNPLVMAGLGYTLKEAATPIPPPDSSQFNPPKRDFSKYAYKGPLNRGEYTYADPEDIAYGRVSPTSYGYLGAKEGGKINFAMGGSSPAYMDPAGGMGVNIMDPAGGRTTQGQGFVPPQPGKTVGVSSGISKIMSQAQKPFINPSQTLQGLTQVMSPSTMPPPQAQNIPQPQMQQPMNNIGNKNMEQLLQSIPRKEIDVAINTLRGGVGMAQGGNVPGLAKNTGQQITGQSSGIGSGVYNNPMSEKQFIDSYLSILPNNLAGNVVRELGLGEQIGQQMYQQYSDSNKKQMAQGGEVETDKNLQENAFVIPADVVGHIGDGSSDEGTRQLQSYLGMNPQQYQAGGILAGEIQGPGGGMDDLIQTTIEGKRAAAVSPQEFVVPRDIVAELGNGSYDKGSNKLYALMKNVRKEKTGTTKQPAELQRGLGQLMRTAAA
tara:strand:- start:1756 stop:3699 length:1944 start_codon:yes stop_codon:yes gene_type:complete